MKLYPLSMCTIHEIFSIVIVQDAKRKKFGRLTFKAAE